MEVFKELEKHDLEEHMDMERSPSPTMRPDHPLNKASFFKREGIPGVKGSLGIGK